MALHSGIDTVAVVSRGIFTITYGASDLGNIANLHASFGLLEDAPTSLVSGRLRGKRAWLLYLVRSPQKRR